jgi:hypothetical protein
LVLFPSVFTKICTICKRLDFLHLFNIEMGVPSLLEVQHPQLRELEIAKCGFERVDLNWLPKLTTQRRRTSSSPAPSCAVSGTQSAGAFPLMRMCAGCSPTTPPHPVAQRRPRLSPSSSAGIFGSTVMGLPSAVSALASPASSPCAARKLLSGSFVLRLPCMMKLSPGPLS